MGKMFRGTQELSMLQTNYAHRTVVVIETTNPSKYETGKRIYGWLTEYLSEIASLVFMITAFELRIDKCFHFK